MARKAKATNVTEAFVRSAEQHLAKMGGQFHSAVLMFVLALSEAIRKELYVDEEKKPRSIKWVMKYKVPSYIDDVSAGTLERCIKGCLGIMTSWGFTYDQLANETAAVKYRMFHLLRPFCKDEAKWNSDGRPNKAEIAQWLKGKKGHQSEDVQKRMGKKKAQTTTTTTTDTTDDAPANPLVSLGNGISAVRNDKKGLVDGQALKTNAFALVALMDEATQIEFYEELRGYKSIVAERERRAKEAQKQTQKQTPKAKATSKRKPARRKPAKRSRKVASK